MDFGKNSSYVSRVGKLSSAILQFVGLVCERPPAVYDFLVYIDGTCMGCKIVILENPVNGQPKFLVAVKRSVQGNFDYMHNIRAFGTKAFKPLKAFLHLVMDRFDGNDTPTTRQHNREGKNSKTKRPPPRKNTPVTKDDLPDQDIIMNQNDEYDLINILSNELIISDFSLDFPDS